MTPEAAPEQKSPALFGRGLIALIAGIVILLVAFLAAGLMQAGDGTSLPAATCGQNTIAYINENLVQEGKTAELLSIRESRGLYELKVKYQSQETTLYTTRDCTLLFTSAMNMKGEAAATQTPSAPAVPVKTVRPAVDLFVMAFCPYGTQAEDVMAPVVGLLGEKADIRIRYITTVTGSTADTVDSLHGMPEAKEDLQQICINRYYPEKYWAYLNAFNEACYPVWQDAAALESCRGNTTAALGIDPARITACADGTEGLDLLRADETASNRYEAYASPTLFINGVKYTGSRTPEAFKKAICAGFETVPAECSTELSSEAVSASGGCG